MSANTIIITIENEAIAAFELNEEVRIRQFVFDLFVEIMVSAAGIVYTFIDTNTFELFQTVNFDAAVSALDYALA